MRTLRAIGPRSWVPKRNQAAYPLCRLQAVTCVRSQPGGNCHLWGLNRISGVLSAVSGTFPGFGGDLLFSHSVMSDSLRPMDCSMPGFPVLHHLPEFAQTHVH